MAHKTLNLAIPFVLILAGSFTAFSQSDKQIAQLKFTLTDFKNPNEFLTRPALIRFSPDGKYLAVSGRTTDIIIYDLSSGQIHSKIDGKGYNAFSFLPDGKTVLARDNDYHIRVFDIDDGKMLRELKGASDVGGRRRSSRDRQYWNIRDAAGRPFAGQVKDPCC